MHLALRRRGGTAGERPGRLPPARRRRPGGPDPPGRGAHRGAEPDHLSGAHGAAGGRRRGPGGVRSAFPAGRPRPSVVRAGRRRARGSGRRGPDRAGPRAQGGGPAGRGAHAAAPVRHGRQPRAAHPDHPGVHEGAGAGTAGGRREPAGPAP
ncbi:hypothetical protein ADZ36_00530 [Streptomyces fradiae]|uniref:Uncharacterized protein n=1 Tax=Streptomyces fradiae TaxID=1906 RepID=A0ACC4WI71_STRFR|nr:hypothetical protein ADZ36_00530 [Streptomyces fradiae]